MPSRLSRSLQLSIRGQPINVHTPLLIPSFSSKARDDIGTLFEALQPSITESLLLSAYDISYGHIAAPAGPLAEILFLDSGGYEVSRDYDIMDPHYPAQSANSWNLEQYVSVLQEFSPTMPTMITSFDHPEIREDVPAQIEGALNLFKEFPGLGRELLFKPETNRQTLVQVPKLIAQVPRFSEFDAIGFTETELGNRPIDRMVNIAKLRNAMDSEGIEKPLHVFGALDPVSTPLYFLAGADIFDGLSWIRFSYWEDLAVYHRNRSPLDFGAIEDDRRALIRCYDANIHYLAELSNRMRRYLLDRDEARFGRHASFFKDAIDDARVRLKGVI